METLFILENPRAQLSDSKEQTPPMPVIVEITLRIGNKICYTKLMYIPRIAITIKTSVEQNYSNECTSTQLAQAITKT